MSRTPATPRTIAIVMRAAIATVKDSDKDHF
jgi:hypothetical protein